jgi:hypothetical protein
LEKEDSDTEKKKRDSRKKIPYGMHINGTGRGA